MGALLAGPQVLCDYLVNRSRPFIYATAPSPLMAAIVRAALRHLPLRCGAAREAAVARRLRRQPARRKLRLARRRARRSSRSSSAPTSARRALPPRMQARGFDIRAVRPPTVPEGTARLRLSLTLNVDEAKVAEHGVGAGRGAEEARRMSTRYRRHRHRHGRRQDRVRRGSRRCARRLLLEAGAGGARRRDRQPRSCGGCRGLPAERVLPEAYRLTTAASPHLAAERDGVEIDVEGLADAAGAPDRALVIEGAGGLLVPLDARAACRSTVRALGRIRSSSCASTRLGTINHSCCRSKRLQAAPHPAARHRLRRRGERRYRTHDHRDGRRAPPRPPAASRSARRRHRCARLSPPTSASRTSSPGADMTSRGGSPSGTPSPSTGCSRR